MCDFVVTDEFLDRLIVPTCKRLELKFGGCCIPKYDELNKVVSSSLKTS